jgi:Fe-S cluster assembly scaffold protein SufB
MLTSYSKLSKPNHNVGDATSQFAVNAQQGTACFAALNTIKTKSVAYVRAPANHNEELGENTLPKPVLILNVATRSGGVADSLNDDNKGVAYHPRTLVVAEDGSRLSVVQSCVDLVEEGGSTYNPTLCNGYTQVFVQGTANVTHSYLEETGGLVTAGVEKSDDEFKEGETLAREVEATRPALKNTHLEAIDVHVMGEEGGYKGTVMSLGGSGRIRIALSVSLLRSKAHAAVNGFSLSGGAQRTDMKTNIHHVAQGTTSEQMQKSMIGGRATGSFRGRIRVEQSAQQTDSKQLSRTILLSDKCRAWAVPSLEIAADDVQCTHGATVSDLSEEELFYLRSRGLDVSTARNILMYAFADDVVSCVDPAILGNVDSNVGLQKRIISRLENLIPQGNRAVKGEFQSS